MRFILCLMFAGILISCGSDSKTPDVGKIDVKLSTERFEQSFFAIDTNNIFNAIDELNKKHPDFTNLFLSRILNADPRWSEDTTRMYIAPFIQIYKPVYDTAQIVFGNFKKQEAEVKKALQYLKYYFPEYKAPEKIITYIGPLDGYGDVLDENAFLVGLHHHLGSDFSLYESMLVIETYPRYISMRFKPNTIAINCMRNVIDDMYRENFEEKSLIIQMVEKGKRLYVLQKLVPFAEEYDLIGYTEKQLKDSYKNEKVIWSLFTQNQYLQSTDMNIVKGFVGEGPRTMELAEDAPGNIGSFVGWQIVKKYMKQNGDLSLKKLMQTNAEEIYTAAKYKP